MKYRCRDLVWLGIIVIATVSVVSARAQQEEPEAEAKTPVAKKAEKKPAGEKQPAARKPGAEEPAPEPDEPAVQALLRSNPSTPAECARAAKILANLGRPDLSKKYLQEVLKADKKQLADLDTQFGSAVFLDLAGRRELLPEAKQVVDAVLAAVNEQLQDPQRLAGLVGQLKDPSPETRYKAMLGLQQARGAAVGPLLEVLGDPGRAAEHVTARTALAGLGGDTVDPLLGILEKAPAKMVAQAIRVLGEMKAARATVHLLAPYAAEGSDAEVRAAAEAALKRLVGRLPTRPEAARMLVEQSHDYFNRRQPIVGEIDGQAQLWGWDAAKKQCVATSYPTDDARRALAARLARDAFAIVPGDEQVRVLRAATMLEAAAYLNGRDKPLDDAEGSVAGETAGLGMRTIEGALSCAMATGHPAAATAAARILGRSGAVNELLWHDARPAPLVLATQSPDRRLRLAAAEAIVRLKPMRPFPGSSYIPPTLAFFAETSGERRALVAGPITEISRELAGMLAGVGLATDTAATGRELARLAAGSPDYELVLIDPAIDQPTIDALLQQLRHDCRTADLRVGLIARAGYFEQAERVARRHPSTPSFARPRDEKAFQWQMGQLAAIAPRDFVGHEERQRQAALALDLMAELSGSPGDLYDLRRVQDSVLTALHVPALSAKAIALLQGLGTPESQRALVDLAGQFTQPPATRKAAVAALRENVHEHGILLTTEEIRRQYDRYNQGASLDAASQQVLGMVLDCLEAPTRSAPAKAGKGKPEGTKKDL